MSYYENINSEKHIGNIAKVGDVIKAYHHAPTADRPDSFLVGHVIKRGICESGYFAYTVQLIANIIHGDPKPVMEYDISYVPYEHFDDQFYADHCEVERVSKVA
tara:strand:- start:31 stop:342 length:312 start_codon:yes stop_codon:yes gene_type:complete